MIFRADKYFVELFERNYKMICFLIFGLMSLIVRYLGKNFISYDAEICLIPWYDTITYNNGINSLNQQVGNYNMLYQTCIVIFTYIPIKGLYCYKIFLIIFDYLLAGVVAYMVYFVTDKSKYQYAACAFVITFFSPIVINVCSLTKNKLKSLENAEFSYQI